MLGHKPREYADALISTYGLESSNPSASLIASDIVDGRTGLNAETEVGDLGDALVRAIPGLEVDVGSPVVGEILRVCATRASRGRGRVVGLGRHAGVERVTSDNLVHVGGRGVARLDQGVDAIDGELGAAEAHQLLGGDELHGHGRQESLQLHVVLRRSVALDRGSK